MIWRIRNVMTKVEPATPDEEAWLREYLSVTRKTYSPYAGKYKTVQVSLLDHAREFPTGLARVAWKAAQTAGIHVDIIDERAQPYLPDGAADLEWLRHHPAVQGEITHQIEAVQAVIKHKRGIVWVPTGGGKCLGIGTPVLKYDGTIVPVESIRPGDKLFGPDSRPKNVLSTTSGRGQLYRIAPLKGSSWTCNDAHILTLVHTETGKVEDIEIAEYLKKSKYWKHCRKLFQPPGVDFPRKKSPSIDPYFLGVWYGDGTRRLSGVQISKPDPEIKALCEDIARRYNLCVTIAINKSCPTYQISSKNKKNPLLTEMRRVIGNAKNLPKKYITGDWETRRQFLAGLLDTDGYFHHGFCEIAQNRKGVSDGIAFLARSLGFRVVEKCKIVKGKQYYLLDILGDLSALPLRIERKIQQPRKQKKNVLQTGFKLEAIGEGDYAGFELDGDGRFLLGDYTVTHNTCIAIGISQALPCRWLFVVHRADLLHQTVERYNTFAGVSAGMIGDGEMDIPDGCRFVVATFQTMHSAFRHGYEQVLSVIRQAEGLIVDEVHVVSADTYLAVTNLAENAYYRVGLSGTPLAKDAERNLRVIGGLGPVIYRVRPEELIAKGLLARPTIRMMTVSQCCERSTWTGVYGEAIVRSRERNVAVVEAVRRAAKPCLVFVQQIKHGRHLEERLRRAGVAVEFVWGKDDTRERRAAIERLVRSQSEVLVCNVIFQEGIDIPSLASVVVATGGASPVAAIQRIGRGMRVDAVTGKSTFEVWDFADQGCGCDGAHTGCRWIERHARERAKAYRAEGFEVAVIPEAAKQLEIEAA